MLQKASKNLKYIVLLLMLVVVTVLSATHAGSALPALRRSARHSPEAVASAEELSQTASVPSPKANVAQIKFRRLTLEDGLSQSSVSCIVQDSRGFMWFSTQDGLNRYDGYAFKVYKHDPDNPDSLSNNRIQLCYTDRRGVLWFVTYDSVLHRHDPLTDRFYRYPLEVEDPYSRRGANILALYGDMSGNLWIGTYGGGLVRYDPETDQLVYYRDDLDDPAYQSEHDNKVYTIYEDRAGILWFGTGEGLVRYDPGEERFVRYPYEPRGYAGPHDPHSLRSQFARIIHEDRAGRLWIGTTYGGLNQLDRETGEFIAYPFGPDNPDAFAGNTVRALHEDRFDRLWVSSAELTPAGTYAHLGLGRLDPETGEIVHYPSDPADPCSLSHESVLLIHEDTQGNLWFHTFRGGVDVYDWDTGCFRHYAHNPDNPESLSDDAVATFYNDAAGGVWVGTGAGGVNLYDPTWTKFPHYLVTAPGAERGSNNSIFGLYAPPSGIDEQGHANALWVSTTAGLNRWDRRTGTFTFFDIDPDIPDVMPYATLEEPAGTLWLGTTLGLYKADLPAAGAPDPETLKFTLVLSRDKAGSVMGIQPDGAGALWLAVYDVGLARFDPVTEELVYYKHDPENTNSLGDNAVRDVFDGRQGAFWIRTASGLDHFDPATETFTHYRPDPDDPQGLSDEVIIALYEEEAGTVWIGTSGDGMQRLDPAAGTFTSYHEEDGLPNDVVYAFLPDAQGNLWVSTNNGVSRFNPPAGTFRNYTQRDGLQSNEFNWKAHYLAPDGEMFLGGVNGINAFYPADIHDNPHAPPVVITGLQVFNEPVDVKPDGILQRPIESTDAIELAYTDRVVSFEFAGLHYAMPDRNQYAYMLEGFDAGWNHVGSRRFATYTNLPPGAYTFRVKAANSDGVWNEAGRALAVTVVPPFWGTWWFRGLIGLMLLGTVAGSYRLRVRSVEARSRELETLVDERTHALEQRTDEIERRRQELEALYRADEELYSHLELEDVLQALVDIAVDSLRADKSAVLCWDEAGERLVMHIANGFSPAAMAQLSFARGEGVTGHVAESGEPAIVEDAIHDPRRGAEHPDLVETVLAEGIRSFMHLPIKLNSEVFGVFNVSYTEPHAFGEDEQRLFTALAQRAAIAIENVRLYEDTRRRLTQLTALQDTTTAVASTLELEKLLNLIVQQAATLVQAEGGVLNLVNWDKHEDEAVACTGLATSMRGYRSPLAGSLSGWVTLHNRPVISNQVPADGRVDQTALEWVAKEQIQTAAAAPLTVKGQVVGTLVVIEKQGGKGEFDQADLDLLVAFASQAATAIENARLFDAEQRRAEQFRAITEVGRRITSILEIDEVLAQIVKVIRDTFGYYHVGIGLIEDGDVVYKVGAGALAEDPNFEFSPARLKVGQAGVTGWVAGTGEPLIVPDVRQERRYIRMRGGRTRSELTVPIKAKSEVIGVLDVQSDQLNAFDETDLAVLQSLAHQAGAAIENARLYERAQDLAVVEERSRLARELHDAVTQTLFSASLLAEVLPATWESDRAEGQQLLQELRQLSRGALAEMRALLLELRPAVLAEADLGDLLHQLADAAAGRTGVPVAVTVEGRCDISEEVHIALYRIAQEALNNVVKHARAEHVSVSLRCTSPSSDGGRPPAVELRVADDGVGFDLSAVPPDHLGLGIIRERAQSIGAELSIDSRRGHGTQVTVVYRGNDSDQSRSAS